MDICVNVSHFLKTTNLRRLGVGVSSSERSIFGKKIIKSKQSEANIISFYIRTQIKDLMKQIKEISTRIRASSNQSVVKTEVWDGKWKRRAR